MLIKCTAILEHLFDPPNLNHDDMPTAASRIAFKLPLCFSHQRMRPLEKEAIGARNRISRHKRQREKPLVLGEEGVEVSGQVRGGAVVVVESGPC